MRINIPSDVNFIIRTLQDAGYEAYAVGGCVRDSVLGREPNDWDITTSAKPEEVKKLFKVTIDTGIQHGTVTVRLHKQSYEVTTYRIDGEYSDHRRPDGVTFTDELKEDLLRRDFTINAMAASDSDGIVDLYGGMQDLEDKVIRCVGDPDKRFDEDALRIMRAVRFAAQLGFDIDAATLEAAKRHVEDLKQVSVERIQVELTKLLVSPHPEKLLIMYEIGITRIILPEFDRMVETAQNNPYHLYDVGRHTIEVMKNVSPEKKIRYAALLHDVGKPERKTTDERGIDHFKGHAEVGEDIAEKVLRRLRMDNDTIKDVKTLVRWHDYGIYGQITKKGVRRMISKMGEEYLDRLIEIKKADMAGQSDYRLEWRTEEFNKFTGFCKEIIDEKSPLKISDLKVGGNDLKAAGVPEGKELGRVLHMLLDEVLDEPEKNEQGYLIRRALEIKNI